MSVPTSARLLSMIVMLAFSLKVNAQASESASQLPASPGNNLQAWQAKLAQDRRITLWLAVNTVAERVGIDPSLRDFIRPRIHGLEIFESRDYPGKFFLALRLRRPQPEPPGERESHLWVPIDRENDTLLSAMERLVERLFAHHSHMTALRTLHEKTGPAPPPPPSTTPLEGGVLNSRAISLPQPAYPAAAKKAGVAGSVVVRVTLDASGNVISARAAGGDPLLHAVSVTAARAAKFRETIRSGQPVKVTGIIVYNFTAQ